MQYYTGLLDVVGPGQEEALLHLLNLVWPNIFETSPHLIGGIMDAIEALRPALGPGIILNYTLAGTVPPGSEGAGGVCADL
ncbi:hypothetical protein CF327_g2983 [Tilletia walkeri]|nr:hypothetical protein CF327_g2983 [Tilletia walkeri]